MTSEVTADKFSGQHFPMQVNGELNCIRKFLMAWGFRSFIWSRSIDFSLKVQNSIAVAAKVKLKIPQSTLGKLAQSVCAHKRFWALSPLGVTLFLLEYFYITILYINIAQTVNFAQLVWQKLGQHRICLN